jgi:L-threonylcarbamoyladenylate synthase
MSRMERFTLDGDSVPASAADDIDRAAAAGALLVYPTETQYGLGCDPRNATAVARLLRLKGRPADKPLPLIAASVETARAAVVLAGSREVGRWERLTARFWPGPLTLIAAAAPGLAPGVAAADGSVGIRVSASAVARGLAASCGGLLVATSANVSGESPAVEPEEVAAALGCGLDLFLDGGRAPGGPPTTLVDVRGEMPRLLRAGPIPRPGLEAALGETLRTEG